MAVQSNLYSNDVSYDCKKEEVTICGVDVASSLDIGFSSRCCSDATVTRWYQEGYQLGISISNIQRTVIQYSPPQPCPEYYTLTYKINVDIANVASFAGTQTIDDGGTITTQPVTSGMLNSTVSHQYYGDYSITYNIIFQLVGGGTVTMNWVYAWEGQFCPGDTFAGNTLTLTEELPHTYTYDSDGCLVLPYALQDGFYTFEIDGASYCLVVDCVSLECRVFTWIDTHVLKCEACNDKETLDKALELYMWFDMLKSTCSDCCTKCAVYDRIIDIVNGCLTC